MGAFVATPVHRRINSTCRPAIIIEDNPPAYDNFMVAEISLNLGLVVWTAVNNVAHDTYDPETSIAVGTNNTWHYPAQCLET